MTTQKISEQSIADFFDKKYALITGRACAGLWLYLKCLGYENKYIAVPDNICSVIPYTISLSGNKPYFIDIDSEGRFDIDALKEIDKNKITAVIGGYVYGNIFDCNALKHICNKNNWELIEDAAQAMGSKINNMQVGSFGEAVITSFGIGKHIDLSVGGAIALNDKALYDKLKKMNNTLPLYNKKKYIKALSEYRALVASVQEYYKMQTADLEILKNHLLFRYDFDDNYFAELTKSLLENNEKTEIIKKKAELFISLIKHKSVKHMIFTEGSTYWRFNILTAPKYRDTLLEYLREKKIKATKYFPACHRLFMRADKKKFANSISAEKRIINLWIKEETAFDDIKMISSCIINFFKRNENA